MFYKEWILSQKKSKRKIRKNGLYYHSNKEIVQILNENKYPQTLSLAMLQITIIAALNNTQST